MPVSAVMLTVTHDDDGNLVTQSFTPGLAPIFDYQPLPSVVEQSQVTVPPGGAPESFSYAEVANLHIPGLRIEGWGWTGLGGESIALADDTGERLGMDTNADFVLDSWLEPGAAD